MARTKIEWATDVWNPIRGCSRVSAGCVNCYAERTAIRHARNPLDEALPGGGPYHGLVKSTPAGPRWTGDVRLVEELLDAPLHWKKPRRVFVNSMSDLFHEKVPDEWIGRIFETMDVARHHAYLALTKRPERMRDFMVKYGAPGGPLPKPLPNVWLGCSVENQETADERIPLLLQTPAAVRWVSYEPALGPVDWSRWLFASGDDGEPAPRNRPGLDWIVVGGESGPGARPFDLAWARSVIAQGKAAGVPVFVKQLGAQSVGNAVLYEASWPAHVRLAWSGDGMATYRVRLRDRKGGDPEDWPEDLRVREWPG